MESITNNMAIVPAGHHNYREVALPLGARLPNFWGYRAFEKSKLQPSFTQPSVDRNSEITIQPQFAYAIKQLERLQLARKGEHVPAPVSVQVSADQYSVAWECDRHLCPRQSQRAHDGL